MGALDAFFGGAGQTGRGGAPAVLAASGRGGAVSAGPPSTAPFQPPSVSYPPGGEITPIGPVSDGAIPGGGAGQFPRRFPAAFPGAGGQAEIVNRWPLPNATKWYPISVDRPTILFPTVVLDGPVYYHPQKNAQLADTDSFRSNTFGIVYIPKAGTWFLKPGFTPSAPIVFLVIDASDPMIAWRYMQEPGANTPTTTRVAVTDSAGDVVAANVFRQWVLIQNNEDATTGQDICICLGETAVFPSGATGKGQILKKGGGANGTLLIAGSFMMRKRISAIHATPATTAYLDITECI